MPIKSIIDLESACGGNYSAVKQLWERLQYHPNTDIGYLNLEGSFNLEGQEPCVAAYLEDGRAKVILVGRRDHSHEIIRFGFQKIPGPRLRSFTVPSGGCLSDETDINYKGFADWLKDLLKNNNIDVIKINAIEEKSLLYQMVVKSTASIMRGFFPFRQLTWRLSTDFSYDAFIKGHKNYRRTQRYLYKKLGEVFGDSYEIYPFSELPDMDKTLEGFSDVSRKSWQETTGERRLDVISLRRKIEYYSKNNQFISFTLKLQGLPVAYWYGFLYKRVLFLEGTAFDPSFRGNSVGTVLLMRLIEYAFENPDIDCLDFGAGNDQGKSLYCDIVKEVVTLAVYAPRPLPIISNLLKSSIEFAHQKARDALKKLHLADKLRQKSRQQ